MLRHVMRRAVALGIIACFLLSLVPAITQTSSITITNDSVVISDKLIDESELTQPQIDALNSVGLGRGTNTNWSAAGGCLLYTSPSPRDMRRSRMPSSA